MSKEDSKEFNFFEYHNQINQENIILSYKGPVTPVLIAELSRDIRKDLRNNKKSGKKVFAIFMELVQNVSYYSSEINVFGDKSRVGSIFIIDQATHYEIVVGNMVENPMVLGLVQRCSKIKEFDREALRAYKRDLRDQSYRQDGDGAGIGLVQVALTADKFDVKTLKMSDEYSFFVLFLDVQK